MKLSIRLVTLLAGTAAGSPTKVNKRETDLGAEALKKYCSDAQFEPGVITTTSEELTGTCRKKADSNQGGFSPQVDVVFCEGFGRPYRGSGGAVETTGYHTIWCGPKQADNGNQPDKTTGLALLNKIISESGDDKDSINKDSIKAKLLELQATAPGTLTDMYNALKAAPSTSKPGLGGNTGAGVGLVTIVGDFINANVGQGGLFGPETDAGRALRTNPFYRTTQPSPFGNNQPVYMEGNTHTKLCVPFKDETRFYWSTSVKRCKTWHQGRIWPAKMGECDTSYAYEEKTKEGIEQLRICKEEAKKNEMAPAQKEEQLRKEEDSCVDPKWRCISSDRNSATGFKFEYCMDDNKVSRAVCMANDWIPTRGRGMTEQEIEEEREKQRSKEKARCVSPRYRCMNWNRNPSKDFEFCMDKDDDNAELRCRKSGWMVEAAPNGPINN